MINESLIQSEDVIALIQPDNETRSVQSEDVTPLVQPAVGSQTIFKVQNWNGGTVNTGLTIEKATFTSGIWCSGTQCSVRLP